MKKSIFALFICALAAICLFAGCSKARGLKIKDSNGYDRVAVTDEDGNPVFDDAGNVIIVDTDSKGHANKDKNGEQATTPLLISDLIESGKNVYCRYFSFKLPSGYDSLVYGTTISLTKGNNHISISYDIDKTVDDKLDAVSTLTGGMVDEGYTPTVSSDKKTICGETATVTEIKLSAQEKNIYIANIVFEKSGVVYSASLTSDKESSPEKLEDIVNSISFK